MALAFSSRGKEHAALAPACSFAICLAATVMFLRVLVEVAAIEPALEEEEAAVVRRGRNTSVRGSTRSQRNTKAYRAATGFDTSKQDAEAYIKFLDYRRRQVEALQG